MKMNLLRGIVSLGLTCGMLQADQASVPNHDLSEWSVGETLFGEEAKLENFDGQVVIIQYWATGCDSCLSQMPQLAKMEESFGDKGLKVIAAEVKGSSKDTIGKILEKTNANFSVTKGATGPVSITGMPYAVAFGANGKLIFNGHPESEEFQGAVKEALKKVKVVKKDLVVVAKEDKPTVSGEVIGERTWTNSEGAEMVASVLKIEGDKVLSRLKKNGKEVPYLIDKLSEEDQKLLKEKAKE